MASGAVTKLVAPLGRVAAQVRRGESVRVEVVVRTRKLGHFFPGGTVDAFDCLAGTPSPRQQGSHDLLEWGSGG